jgi:BirA family biotin operon repressor/biotin-[acetyl-CoA-carboxylase] ligase
VAGVRVELKWPNDLLVAGAKCAGILCELATWGIGSDGNGSDLAEGGLRRSTGSLGKQAVVVGIGIDLRRPPGELPEEMGEGVSFLEEVAGAPVQEPLLAAALLVELRRWVESAPRLMKGDLRREWESRDALKGRAIRVLGVTDRMGIARGVAPGGALLLEAEGGEIEEVWSGTIRTI